MPFGIGMTAQSAAADDINTKWPEMSVTFSHSRVAGVLLYALVAEHYRVSAKQMAAQGTPLPTYLL
jgi:hypothetical protein